MKFDCSVEFDVGKKLKLFDEGNRPSLVGLGDRLRVGDDDGVLSVGIVIEVANDVGFVVES